MRRDNAQLWREMLALILMKRGVVLNGRYPTWYDLADAGLIDYQEALILSSERESEGWNRGSTHTQQQPNTQ